MSDREIPKPDWKDNTLAVIKIGASAIPVAGGPIVEGLNFIDIRYLSGKRLRDFCSSINDRLVMLEQRGKGPSAEELAKNETFTTTLLHAIQAATRSHQKEKIQALRNAALNSALSSAPDEDMQLIFINVLDSMTASHIGLLLFLANLEGDIDYATLSLIPYIGTVLPQASHPFYSLILKQLKEKGLFDLHEGDGIHKLYRSRITSLGHQLVEFIKSPIEDGHEGTQDE